MQAQCHDSLLEDVRYSKLRALASAVGDQRVCTRGNRVLAGGEWKIILHIILKYIFTKKM